VLEIGASTVPGHYILPAALARFKERRPGVDIRLSVSNSQSVRNGVREGTFELGMVGSMLAAEDFTWFSLRALAPLDGDANGGKLIMHGEWTTQFMGSTDAYFMAVPNWYFLSLTSAAVVLVAHRRQPVALVNAP
jgi:hypothetical protein